MTKWIAKKEHSNEEQIKTFYNPKYISIEIQDKCNLRCRICNQWKEVNNLKKLDFDNIKRLIDELKKYYPDAILEFSGPEPLMNLSLLLKSLDYARSKNVRTALSTNGILLSKENVEALLNLGLNHISVSLDGSKPETNDYTRSLNGSFKTIIDGIKRLVEYKQKNKHIATKISITCVITDKNVAELVKVYYFCKELGVDSINYNTYVPDNSYSLNKEKGLPQDEFWVKKENIPILKARIKELLRLKKNSLQPVIATDTNVLKKIPKYFELKLSMQERCLAGLNYFHITNFGEVTVCGKGPHLNIKKKGIKEIWESKEFQKTRSEIENCKKPCLNNCFRLN